MNTQIIEAVGQGVDTIAERARKKALLEMYAESRDEVEDLAERIIRMRTQAERMTVTLSHTPHAVGEVSDKVQRCVSEALALEELYERRMEENLSLLARLEKAIDRLPRPMYRRLIRLKYLDGYSWEDVADALGVSSRQLQRKVDRLIDMMII